MALEVGAVGFGFYDLRAVEKEGPIKGRIRLWLQGERAMGLSALAVRMVEAGAGFVAEAAGVGRGVVGKTRERAKPRELGSSGEDSREMAAGECKGAGEAKQAVVAMFVGGGDGPISGPGLPREEKIRLLSAMDEKEVKGCRKCGLSESRTHTVFGEGDREAEIFFIGEGPGESEDLSGRPFVGRAGQKLDEMIAAMGLRRDEVFIANIVKCRPPGNRAPAPEETGACTGYLVRQLEIVRPKVIVTLGLPAARYITKLELSMGRMRGEWHTWRGIKVMPTYHPSYILRNYSMEIRKAVWSDLQKVMAELGLKGKRV
ncbi:MAG: uracil-DNA glycosylase [Planctomycetota bacterium]|nr:uracil-DNA glycosylase [Planctomycetota bacterium]